MMLEIEHEQAMVQEKALHHLPIADVDGKSCQMLLSSDILTSAGTRHVMKDSGLICRWHITKFQMDEAWLLRS